ncbi:MAG: esterase [Rhizobacter sp.]|nr:esterase [Rhizobacter sp.]
MNPFKLRNVVARATRLATGLTDAKQAATQTMRNISAAKQAFSLVYKTMEDARAKALEQAAKSGSASGGANTGAGRVGRTAGDVIDVEAHFVEDPSVMKAPHPAAAPPSPAPSAPKPAPPAAPRASAPSSTGRARFLDGTFSDAGATRGYKLFVPEGPTQGLPLVVMLHGCTQDAADFAAGTGMNTLAEAQRFLVLYPTQPKSANASKCWNWFEARHQRRGDGEASLLAALTRQVVGEYRLDADRVYVAGLSAGGAMAAILGSQFPEVFAAVGVHSGLPSGAAHDMPSAFMAMKSGAAVAPGVMSPPTIVFHGDRDTTVNPVNGQRVIAIAAGAKAARPTSVEEGRAPDGGHSFTRSTHRDGRGHVSAEQWVVHGAAHAWSGGLPAGSYTDARGPSATAEMVRFFLEHPRSTAP